MASKENFGMGFKKKEVDAVNTEFAKGGDQHMFGHQAAGPEAPGTTAHDTKGDGGKYAEGGKTKMFAYSPAVPAKAGITGPR
jgi:hypothetical protein